MLDKFSFVFYIYTGSQCLLLSKSGRGLKFFIKTVFVPMSGKTFASLVAFFIILITGVLIYFNEHVIIRNFETYERDKISVLLSNLKHAVKFHLLNGENEKFLEIVQDYKNLPGVKLIAILDSLGDVIFYVGDQAELPHELSSFQADVLQYIPERKIYEIFSWVGDDRGKIAGVVLKVEATLYRGSVSKTNLLVFTIIALVVILGFAVVITSFNRKVLKPISGVSGLMQDIARGVYNVQLKVPHSSDIYEFAENFNQMVRLLDEKEGRLERQKSQFKVISEISRLGLDIKSIDEFFKSIVTLIRNEFNFLNVIYFTIDPLKKLRLSAVSGYLENYIDESYVIEVGYGIAGSSVLIGDVIVINDVSKSPQFVPLYDAPIQSEMAIPVRKKGKIVGVLDISSDKINAFTSEDVRVFKTIAETISVILEKFDSTVENVRLLFKLESVYKLTRDLVLMKDIDKIFENAAKIIYSILGKKELVVEIYERVENLLVMKTVYGSLKEPLTYEYIQSINEGIIGKAVREKTLIYVPDIILEPEAVRYYKTVSSEVIVPLIVENEAIGAINCESGVINAFDNVDILVLRTIADTLSIVVHNAKMYQKISESESKYRTIFENSSEAIFRIDQDGRFVEVNPTFVKIFGFTSEDKVSLYDLFVSSQAAERFKEELKIYGQVSGFDAQLRNKEDKTLNVKISLKILAETPIATYYDGIIVDLTEYLAMKDKIYEADKLRGLAQIAGGMAHEFNNIFAGILGSAQLIKMKVSKEDKIYYWADIIERSTMRGADLVKKLVAYAGGGKLKISRVNINELIIEVLKEFKHLDKITLKTEFEPQIPEILGDYDQIAQVFYNVIQNGIEAMGNGGTLHIKTGHEWVDQKSIGYPEFNAGEYVYVIISDTGIGMSEEVLSRIFEPFFTTKRTLGKSGLGLSMVYGIVRNHGGYITVSSAPGKGSRFSIFFPVGEKQGSNG